MTLKEIGIGLAIMAVIGAGFSAPAIYGNVKEKSIVADKANISSSNTDYFQSTSVLSVYETDIKEMNNPQMVTIFNGLVELYKDEDYVRDNFKKVNVGNLISNRFLSGINNKSKEFVTHIKYLDIVLTDDDFDEGLPEYVLEDTNTGNVSLDGYQFSGWTEIGINALEIREKESAILVAGFNDTEENLVSFSRGIVPGKIERKDISIDGVKALGYYNNTSMAGYTIPNEWVTERLR